MRVLPFHLIVLGAVGCAQLAAGEPHSAPARGAVAHINATTRNHSASAETVLIADNGTAKLPILISERAGTETKTRANELAAYLERITGGKFEVKVDEKQLKDLVRSAAACRDLAEFRRAMTRG